MLQAKEVAKLIRVELKASFSGVKFSVTTKENSVRIYWVDGLEFGATTKAVRVIADKNNQIGYEDNGDPSLTNVCVIIDHEYSEELQTDLTEMLQAYYGERFSDEDWLYDDTKESILNLGCYCNILEKPYEYKEKEPVNNQNEGLDGVIEYNPEKHNQVWCIVESEGLSNEPYSLGGAISKPVYFDSVESLEKALQTHSKNMVRNCYDKCWIIVTLPNNDKQTIELEINRKIDKILILKKIILTTLKEIRQILVGQLIDGNFEGYKGWKSELEWYDINIKLIQEIWFGDNTNHNHINYRSLYENWVKRLIKEGNLESIKNFEDWKKDLTKLL